MLSVLFQIHSIVSSTLHSVFPSLPVLSQGREHIYGTSSPATFSTGELAVATFQGFQDKDQNPDQQEATGQRQATPWRLLIPYAPGQTVRIMINPAVQK